METVFKVGMKVYDSLNFPDKEGIIIKIEDYGSEYPIAVCFNKDSYRCYYDLNGCIIKGKQPTLSTKPYKVEFQGFEQETVPTYEDAVKWVESNSNYNPAYVEVNEKEKMFLSKEDFYAFDALRKLIILRDYYNEGWVADLSDSKTEKYCIVVHMGCLSVTNYDTLSSIMSFKSVKIRDKFLEEQRELLEIAKPLL